MAAKDKAAKAAAAAQAAKENPYLQRVIQDDELRDNMVVAFEAARNAYAPAEQRQVPDEEPHRGQEAAREPEALRRRAARRVRGAARRAQARDAEEEAQGRPRPRSCSSRSSAARSRIAVSEGLRNKVLDALFGAEEEFDYTSNTTPAAPAEAAPAS